MKLVRTISSVTLAFLVLFSSSSFMVDMHLCAGRVQDVALFTKADVCAMERIMPPCHKHETSSCCDDESIIHTGENFNTTISDISFAPLLFTTIELPGVFLAEIIPSAQPAQFQFYLYDPPLRPVDRTTDLQVFNI